MIFDFLPDSEEQRSELSHIVEIEANSHFEKNDISNFCKHYCGLTGITVHIEISNYAYFNDIEKAKKEMYDMKEHKYMKDFVSEVLENLSFVPKVSAK